MNENIINESKAIKVLFQKLINDNYKQKEYRDIYTIDILPKIVNNTIKYEDFEANILKNNSYNILNKYVLALSKLYLYDNDINRFIDDIIYNLSVKNKRMDIIFNELKIGLEINSWCIKIMDFGCSDLRFVMDMFKSEGLFIRRPYF